MFSCLTWDYRLSVSKLGTVSIANPGVSLSAQELLCWGCCFCMGAIGAGGPTTSCSLFKVCTAPLMVTLQMFSERVTLPILLTSVENKAQRWGLRY